MRTFWAFLIGAVLATAPVAFAGGKDCCGGEKGAPASAAGGAEKASVCAISADPAKWNGKLVELCGKLETDPAKKGLFFSCGDKESCRVAVAASEAPPADQLGVAVKLTAKVELIAGAPKEGPKFRLVLQSVEKMKAEGSCGEARKDGCCGGCAKPAKP